MSAQLPARQRDLRTAARHQREAVWQIGFPLALAVVGGLALMILAASPAQAVRQGALADTALILLILPVMLAGLLILVFLTGLCAFVLPLILRELPYRTRQVHEFVWLAAGRVRSVAERLTGAVQSIRSISARARAAVSELQNLFPFGRH